MKKGQRKRNRRGKREGGRTKIGRWERLKEMKKRGEKGEKE